jgi:hypothetical protein
MTQTHSKPGTKSSNPKSLKKISKLELFKGQKPKNNSRTFQQDKDLKILSLPGNI